MLPLFRQFYVYNKPAHCRSVSHIATSIFKRVQREMQRKVLLPTFGKITVQRMQIRQAENLHSTTSNAYRILQKTRDSIESHNIWTSVAFQLVNMPRRIFNTYGQYICSLYIFHYNFPFLFRNFIKYLNIGLQYFQFILNFVYKF